MPEYKVLDAEALWISGKRIPDDRIVTMTAEDAEHPLRAGQIEPYLKPEPESASVKAKAKE